MFKKHYRLFLLLITLFTLMGLILVACGGDEEPTEVPEVSAPEVEVEEPEAPAVEVTGSVGIVLPTREEPRWIQDETRSYNFV